MRRRIVGAGLLAAGLAGCGSGTNDGASGGGASASGSAMPGSAPSALGSYSLRLVNPRPYVIVVLASADAAEVVVDTVPPTDSLLVQLVLDSDLVRLRAVDLEGNELGSGYVGVADANDIEPADSALALRWELPPPP